MKYLILSDIHGCLPALQKVLAFWSENSYDMILILGDILNYGPRNGLPEGLDAPGIVSALNPLSPRIVAVRGNCDSEVDQMLLQFPCLSDYSMVVAEGRRILLSHGHKVTAESLPKGSFDVFISGHTHLWELHKEDGAVICNTGSITFPKQGRPATFATIDEDMVLRIRLMDGSVLAEQKL